MTPSLDHDRYLDHLIDQHTTTDDAADLARDEAYASWCDEHRDAWIAAVDAEEVTL